MESCYKSLPKNVVQETNKSCWAAVLESWLGILPGRSWRPKQSELMDMYPDLTFSDGSIKPKEFVAQIAPQTGMSCSWIDASTLTASYLADKLQTEGHLIIGYLDSSRSVRGGHVVVCYGVGRPDGKNQKVAVMDPSKDAGFKNRDLSYFKPLPSENSKILIGSPKKGLDSKYF
ncbi:MAG TPA: papain-like cysteine protease family protein [Pyrinomonadaceae bacterium]|nr:papain-like cysteine protease family protein [Pyrinomonadaceae bacterium]